MDVYTQEEQQQQQQRSQWRQWQRQQHAQLSRHQRSSMWLLAEGGRGVGEKKKKKKKKKKEEEEEEEYEGEDEDEGEDRKLMSRQKPKLWDGSCGGGSDGWQTTGHGAVFPEDDTDEEENTDETMTDSTDFSEDNGLSDTEESEVSSADSHVHFLRKTADWATATARTSFRAAAEAQARRRARWKARDEAEALAQAHAQARVWAQRRAWVQRQAQARLLALYRTEMPGRLRVVVPARIRGDRILNHAYIDRATPRRKHGHLQKCSWTPAHLEDATTVAEAAAELRRRVVAAEAAKAAETDEAVNVAGATSSDPNPETMARIPVLVVTDPEGRHFELVAPPEEEADTPVERNSRVTKPGVAWLASKVREGRISRR